MAVKVLDGVFLGDAEASFDPEFLDMNKISNLVNLSGRETANAYASHGLVYLSYMWEDNDFFSLYDPRETGLYSPGKDVGSSRVPIPFNEISEFIDTSLRYGISVLIFCQDGGGRTAVAMCAYLMLKYRWSYNKALELIMSKKPNAMPNKSFLKQLEDLDKYLLLQRGHLKKRSTPHEDLVHPKVQGNGSVIYDMIADFPQMAFSRWNHFELDYLEAQKTAIQAVEASNEEKKGPRSRQEVKEDAEYDHQSPAMRDVENEMVVVVSHVNMKRIQPAPSETMALDKPRSKGRRLKFRDKLSIQLGPETSENGSLAALRQDRGGGGRRGEGKTTPFGDRGGRKDGAMSINGTGLGSSSRSVGGPLDGGDSMDMSSIDGSEGTIRSSLRGSRKSGRANPLDFETLMPYKSLEAKTNEAGSGSRPGNTGAGIRLNPGGGGDGEGRRFRHGEGREGPSSFVLATSSLSPAANSVSTASMGDLYGFVGMDSDPVKTAPGANYNNNKFRVNSGAAGAINSPGRQVEVELAKVTALMSASDKRVHDAKNSSSGGEGGSGAQRRLVNRKVLPSSSSEEKENREAKSSSWGSGGPKAGTEERETQGEDKYGEDFEPADEKPSSGDDSIGGGAAKLSLHDLAHRPIYDVESNMHAHASPSSLSPAARERERKRKDEAVMDDGFVGNSNSNSNNVGAGKGKDAKYSLEMLAAGGVGTGGGTMSASPGGTGGGGFVHTMSSSAGRPSRHHVTKSGTSSGSPTSHDRTRDLSTSTHGRGEFRDVVQERAAGMNDDDRGVARGKIHRHRPPSSSAQHSVFVDDPLAAFDPLGGDWAPDKTRKEGGGSPLRSGREQIIPIKYPMDRTRPTSASIANSGAMSSTRTGRPGSGTATASALGASAPGRDRRAMVGADNDAGGPYRSPYSGSARPGSAKATRGPGTFGTSARPGSARAPASSKGNNAGAGAGAGYASVYLKGTGAKQSSGKGSVASLGEVSQASNPDNTSVGSTSNPNNNRRLVRRTKAR